MQTPWKIAFRESQRKTFRRKRRNECCIGGDSMSCTNIVRQFSKVLVLLVVYVSIHSVCHADTTELMIDGKSCSGGGDSHIHAVASQCSPWNPDDDLVPQPPHPNSSPPQWTTANDPMDNLKYVPVLLTSTQQQQQSHRDTLPYEPRTTPVVEQQPEHHLVVFIDMIMAFLNVWNTIIVPRIIIPIYIVLVLVYIGAVLYDTHYPHPHGMILLRRLRSRMMRHDHHRRHVASVIPTSTQNLEVASVPPPPPHTRAAIQQQHQVPNPSRSVTTTAVDTNDSQHAEQQPIDMTGSYQMKSHDNLDLFLSIQGVPWPLRRAAAAVYPVHHITHRSDHLTIQIEAKSSGFTTQTNYMINGPPVETNVRGRIFSDQVYYSYDPIDTHVCHGIITEKRAITEGYIVTVLRKLVTSTAACSDPNNNDVPHINDPNQNNHNNNSGNPAGSKGHIHMTSTVSFPNEVNKPDIVCTQVFERLD
jgi:hypothetical protein